MTYVFCTVSNFRLVERFLLDGYKPQQLSTYALSLFRYHTKVEDESVIVDFWDTAGQEMFQSMHPSYYHQAHACIMVFDSTRKVTYKNLATWYQELRQHRPHIPVFCAANKIDTNMDVTQKSFAFPQKHNIPLYYVSASDGTNVVKVL
ncbi:Rab-like protein 2A [Cryptotermes secundus]|uniref:Rab-like protein 2A n=1 Tax=Cryptotermes secundus TaxID=105785 RepID=A0A2J7Q300_9NEOP|nr:Rab-like protein 2A [Cryptotermes secundus]